jgi:predicted nucleic acid-binding protein
MDTGFVVALVNENDQYHQKALKLANQFEGYPTAITDVILLEIGNSLAKNFKAQAIEIINHFYLSPEEPLYCKINRGQITFYIPLRVFIINRK